MERLSFAPSIAEVSAQSGSSAWLTENVWHPFVNGTGVKQIYNNFVEEKLDPSYVPPADTFSKDWIVHTLASTTGALLTYAAVGKATGMGLSAISSRFGIEGAAAKFLTSNATGQILGAGLFDFTKAPNQGETRLGNSLGSMAAFTAFHVGNNWLSQSKTIASSNIYTGIGRATVGAVGGLTGLETANFINRSLLADAHTLTADDRWRAVAQGAFLNTALPPLQQKLSDVIDGRSAQSHRLKVEAVPEPNAKSVAFDLDRLEDLFDAAARKGEAEPRIKVTLLKQQFEPSAKQAQMRRVAGDLATFIGGAKKSLHTAIYDFRLRDPAIEKVVVDALNNRAENGVDVKLAFFQPKKAPDAGNKAFSPIVEPVHGEIPVSGPSPELMAKLSPKIGTKGVSTEAGPTAAHDGGIPDPFADALGRANNHGLIDLQTGKDGGLDSHVGTAGITGGGKLMHNKYIVRDAGTPEAAVWTGSTNFTDEAFGSQDNNIIQIKSRALARVYEKNFGQLWEKGSIAGTGKDLNAIVSVGGSSVTVAFSPGDGAFIDAEFARRIEAADKQVHIASMVISSPKILQALADRIAAGKTVEGIYDGPQMRNVVNAWGRSTSEESAVKIALWDKVKGSLTPKNSHPYAPDGPHDFMHNKTVAVDESVVLTGSFNLSNNAAHNAENIVAIENGDIAKQYTAYIKDLVQTYKGAPRRVAGK